MGDLYAHPWHRQTYYIIYDNGDDWLDLSTGRPNRVDPKLNLQISISKENTKSAIIDDRLTGIVVSHDVSSPNKGCLLLIDFGEK